MINQGKPLFKIRLQYELAIKIIIYSFIIILIGISYLFASNLLTFNIYSVFFALTALFVIYLKRNSYLTIEENVLSVRYLKYYTQIEMSMDDICEIIVNKEKAQVEIKGKQDRSTYIYLDDLAKEKLLHYMVQNYPNISCIVLD